MTGNKEVLLGPGRVQEARRVARQAPRHVHLRNPVNEAKVHREFSSGTFQHLAECWLLKVFYVLKSDVPIAVLSMRTILHEDAASEFWRSPSLHKEHELPYANGLLQRRQ